MKRILFSMVVLAGAMASCTNEAFETAGNNVNDASKARTQLDLVLQNGNAETRFTTSTGEDFGYVATDVLGAVLVDNGVQTNASGESVVDWTIADSHVGNNKWTYTAGKGFATEGTTSIGAWLFYSRYNKEMTQTRNGVEYTFPQIQEYAEDLTWAANNNVNFVVSPIYRIDGYEGERIDLPVNQAPIHTHLKLNLQFPTGVGEVQKIVLTAKDATGAAVDFPTKGRIINTKLPVANLLSTGTTSYDPAYELPTHALHSRSQCIAEECGRAYNQLVNSGTYAIDLATVTDATLPSVFTDITEAVGNNKVPFLVLDCVENHGNEKAPGVAVVDNKFTSYMVVPAGIYQSITLYVYTDKGIYKKTVDERDAAVASTDPDKLAADKKNILLRRYRRVNLANVAAGTSEANGFNDLLKITASDLTNAATVASELGGVVITKTADLIAAIEGATQKTVNFLVVNQKEQNLGADAAIPAHNSIINKAVADAVLKKWSDARTNVTLTFLNQNMTVEGEAEAYDLVGMTFLKGATLTKGSVNVAERIHFGNDAIKINSGATANFTAGTSSSSEQNFAVAGEQSTIINDGTVNFQGYAKIDKVENATGAAINIGTETKAAGLTIGDSFVNRNVVNVTKGYWNTGALTNSGTVNNSATIDFYDGTSTNSGTINNLTENSLINVRSTVVTNGTIVNNVKAKIISGKYLEAGTGELNNSGKITNYGQMYCLNGNHTINNTGIIEAKADSRTYITTNSSATETSGNSVTRGEVKVEARDADMTVAKADYQGRISWIVPTTITTLTSIPGDKFNMVYLNGNCALPNATNKVKYVTIQKDAKVTMPQNLLELTANADVTLTVNKKSVAILNIARGKTLTVPTENVIGLFDYAQNDIINATVAISNLGTMLVGGQCYSSELDYPSGIFASGSGNNDEAYFWGKSTIDM